MDMISLLQQTAPVVVEEHETVVVTDQADPGTVTVIETETTHMDTTHVVEGAEGATIVDGHAVTDTHTAMGHEPEAATGMPQLDITTFGNQIFWLLVTLAVIYWVLARIALPRIGSVLADRQGAVTGDLMAAEELKRKARDAEAAYEQALGDARSEAGKIVAANKAAIQKELDAAVAQADAEISARAAESEKRIGAIRASAVEDARSVAKDVAAELVRAFGGQADQAAIDGAVDGKLKGAV
ncbi:F0F1 ATP synthase subunit B' [Paracoccus jiaweipingae]|uniref:F0F1 ATP synthase subunit B' n=1 Tax=unclassified Paracoccus (in: a-proteobacteria) TaxID=2688777 RepID=UPI00379D2E32